MKVNFVKVQPASVFSKKVIHRQLFSLKDEDETQSNFTRIQFKILYVLNVSYIVHRPFSVS